MPTFFNKDNLTKEQSLRWDFSVLEYQRVIDRNLDMAVTEISDGLRSYYAKEHNAKTDAEIKSSMQKFAELMGRNQPGHPKSSLFARLLDGKAPLPFPPPMSYSYPWYSVIEDNVPHRVRFERLVTAGSLTRSIDSSKGGFEIILNQDSWTVTSCNAAARILVDLEDELQRVAKKPDPDSELSSIYEWPEELLQRVKKAYAAGPEFMVRNGKWPAFRLSVAQLDESDACHQSRKWRAREALTVGVQLLRRTGSVFDLDALCMNARIGKTLIKGVHPKEALEEARSRCNASVGNPLARIENLAADMQQESLEADIAKFEANPDRNDWVQFFVDVWYLEKAGI